MRRQIILGVLAMSGALSLTDGGRPVVYGQEPARSLHIQFVAGLKSGADPLKRESMFSAMYLVTGGGRHVAALDTDDGVVLVDTKPAGWGSLLEEKIGLVTDHPIAMIVNSNPTGAANNSSFQMATDIIAHENTRADLARLDAFKGPNARFLPNKTFKDRLSLKLKTVGEFNGTNRVDLYYFGSAHSNGDIVAVFPSFGVAFLGDLFPGRMAPVIDTANGGSLVAFPDTVDKAVAALKDLQLDALVPGRADPPGNVVQKWMSVSDLQEYADFNREFLKAVRASLAAGKSVDQAVATLALPDKYKSYTMDNARANVAAIYNELKK